jgi:hemin uptake protein HemP
MVRGSSMSLLSRVATLVVQVETIFKPDGTITYDGYKHGVAYLLRVRRALRFLSQVELLIKPQRTIS